MELYFAFLKYFWDEKYGEVCYALHMKKENLCPGGTSLTNGGDLIVHANNSKPYPQGGIKVSNAKYREILTIRRVIE